MSLKKGGKVSILRLSKTYGQKLCANLLSLQMVNKHMRRGREFCFDFGKISKSKYKQRKTFRLGFNRLELSRRFACFLHTWSTEMSKLTNNMQNKLFSNANDQMKFSSSNLAPFALTTIFGRFRAAQDNKCFQSLRKGAE